MAKQTLWRLLGEHYPQGMWGDAIPPGRRYEAVHLGEVTVRELLQGTFSAVELQVRARGAAGRYRQQPPRQQQLLLQPRPDGMLGCARATWLASWSRWAHRRRRCMQDVPQHVPHQVAAEFARLQPLVLAATNARRFYCLSDRELQQLPSVALHTW